ncbi:hypothetical protein EBR96_03625, partial [bacterium]|nr:hypothetical protein [bacterium]
MKKRLTVPGSLKEYDALCFGRLVKALYTYVTQVSDDDAFKTLFSELKKWTETIFSDKPASDLVMTKTNIYMYRLLSMITGNEDDGPIPVGEIAQLLRESKFETAVQWRDAQKRMIASALSMDWESVARKNRHFFDSPTKLEAFNIKLLRCFHRVILTGLTFKGPKAILKLCEVTEGNPSIDSVLLKSVISYLERITIDRQTAAYFSDEKDKLVEVVKKRIERMKGVQKSNPTDIALLEERLRNVDDPARIPIWDEIEARRTLQIRTHQALMFQGGLGDEAKAMLRYDYEALYNRLSLLALSRVLSQRMYYYFV